MPPGRSTFEIGFFIPAALIFLSLSWFILSQFGDDIVKQLGIPNHKDVGRLSFSLILAVALVTIAHHAKWTSVKLTDRSIAPQWLRRYWIIYPLLTFLLWAFFQKIDCSVTAPPEPWMSSYTEEIKTGGLSMLVVIIGICILAPIGEELVFRQMLVDVFPIRKRHLMLVLSWLFSSLLFTIAHMCQYQNPTTLIWIFVVGSLCFVARVASGGIALPILVHVTSNSLAVVATYFEIEIPC
ncbi:CPBP family intramembrane glutamic endopeptidase [Pseudomonas aeruginosa]|uniref:CPBP family intramembrane glutamic endopeptidase n=1 Tax=Pseudomonas aeruginosa TaxID=287 RepID=UPI001FC9F2F2|nr:type II CAAX endopeptidase family protein [Pseudomonas aeruginosa]